MTTRHGRGQVVLALGSPWRSAVTSRRGGRLGETRRLRCRRAAIDGLFPGGSLLPGGNALGPGALERAISGCRTGVGTAYVSLTMSAAHTHGLCLVTLENGVSNVGEEEAHTPLFF